LHFKAQTVISSCIAPDSIVKKYKDDADKLAVVRVYSINSTYKDSVQINKPIRDNYLKALIAVFNATALPAIDTVVNILKIHKYFNPILNSLIVTADSNLIWMKNIRYNIYPSGSSSVDYLMNKYYLQKQSYSAWPLLNHMLVLKTDTNCNMDALANKFQAISGVNIAGTNGVMGDGNNITDSIGANYTSLIYSYGWGDCPAGCGSRRYWHFKVYNDCSVEYMGSYGSAIHVYAGLKESSILNSLIKIYPNPSNGIFNIELDKPCKLKLYNMLGELVFENAFTDAGNFQINISNLANGIYQLKAENEQRSFYSKLIKE
jgi:hypothetical protein